MERQDQSSSPPSTVTGRKATSEEVAFRDGYVRGRSAEMRDRGARDRDRIIRSQQQRAAAEANNTAATALILGVFLAGLAGILGAVFHYAQAPTSAPEAGSNPESEEVENSTAIERTIERTEEVAPVPEEFPVPDVEINLPPTEGPAESSSTDDSNTAPEASGISEEARQSPESAPAR